MPDNLVQRLSDKLTIRDIELLRLAAHDELLIEAEVAALAEELVRRLIHSDPTATGPLAGQGRLDKVIAGSVAVIRDVYRALYAQFRAQLILVMADEYSVMTKAVAESLGVSNRTASVLVGPGAERSALRDIIDNRVITANANDAERLRGFFEREAASHHRRYAGALRQAFSQDETITQMMARLRQVTEIVARETDAVVRSGYNHVISQLRIEQMQRNSVLFRGVVCVAILDNRTSAVCQARSRGMWDLNTGRPLPGSPVQTRFPGPPPWHFNCRSQLHPLTRTADEMARNGGDEVRDAINSLTPEQRRLLSADPPDDETYSQWLRRQSSDVQKEVLGTTRQKMWLEGRLELTDLVNQKGRPLTLKQLSRKIT